MKTSTRNARTAALGRPAARRNNARGAAVSQIELLRMRVATAAATWKQAKEHLAQAKRRRKLAKLLARRAKKDARAAKENLEELREALADAQTHVANPWQAAMRRFSRTKTLRVNLKKRPARRARVRKK